MSPRYKPTGRVPDCLHGLRLKAERVKGLTEQLLCYSSSNMSNQFGEVMYLIYLISQKKKHSIAYI